MVRAVFEGVAMEARRVSDALFELPGVGEPQDFRLIGGGTRNSLFLDHRNGSIWPTTSKCG